MKPNQWTFSLAGAAGLALLTACGALPGAKKTTGGGSSAAQTGDATADKDHNAAFIASITSDAVKACHDTGFVFERRQAACSTDLKLAQSFTCDRAGIRSAFAPTGFQIDEALDQALGQEDAPDDHGDGFIIEECGESDAGRRFVQLVKSGDDGQLKVREIEADL